MLNIFEKTIKQFFKIIWQIENWKEQHLLEIELNWHRTLEH